MLFRVDQYDVVALLHIHIQTCISNTCDVTCYFLFILFPEICFCIIWTNTLSVSPLVNICDGLIYIYFKKIEIIHWQFRD